MDESTLVTEIAILDCEKEVLKKNLAQLKADQEKKETLLVGVNEELRKKREDLRNLRRRKGHHSA